MPSSQQHLSKTVSAKCSMDNQRPIYSTHGSSLNKLIQIRIKISVSHIWIHWCYGAWYVGMCWRCVGSVAGWRWVAQPHPAPASAVPGLTALVPHCQPSPVVPRTQACTLHSAGTPTVPCCQYILWGSVCEPSVNQTPGNVPRCIQRGVFLSLFSNGEIVLKHSLLGNHLMSCVL